MADRSF